MLGKVKIPRHSPTADEFIKNLDVRDSQYQINDLDIKGLCIRVHPSGNKSWLFRYNIKVGNAWKGRAIKLGDFKSKSNSSEGLTTVKARQQASIYKFRLHNENIDPQEEREKTAKKRKESELELTVFDLFKLWFQDEIRHRKDGGAEAKRMLEKDVLPHIGTLPIKSIRKRDIATINSKVKKRSDRMAYAVFSLIRQMFTYAIEQDLLDFDPTYGIKKSKVGSKGKIRERFLNDSEIEELFKKLPESDLQPRYQLAIKIILGTCCRVGELSKAKWENIDLNKRIWLIPETDCKNGKKHKVWLSEFVLEQFLKLYEITGHTIWCFPSRLQQSHISTRTISKHVLDRQKTLHKRIKSRTSNYDALLLMSGDGEQWRPHDLRRTGATIMVRHNAIGEVVERCLNHLEQNRLKKTYLQYDYWNEMQNAWDLLGEKLEALDKY